MHLLEDIFDTNSSNDMMHGYRKYQLIDMKKTLNLKINTDNKKTNSCDT